MYSALLSFSILYLVVGDHRSMAEVSRSTHSLELQMEIRQNPVNKAERVIQLTATEVRRKEQFLPSEA